MGKITIRLLNKGKNTICPSFIHYLLPVPSFVKLALTDNVDHCLQMPLVGVDHAVRDGAVSIVRWK